jgi:hypothetical protein
MMMKTAIASEISSPVYCLLIIVFSVEMETNPFNFSEYILIDAVPCGTTNITGTARKQKGDS